MPYLIGFDEFWKVYPRRVAKLAAMRAWNKVWKESGAIMEGLKPWLDSREWADPLYIPHPSTFLNQRRWEDQPVNSRKTLAEVEVRVGTGPEVRTTFCSVCHRTGSWHLNAAKRGQVDHEFAEAV